MGIRSFVVFPIAHQNRTLGTLCAAYSERVSLDANTLEKLRLISEALSHQLYLSHELTLARQLAITSQQQVSDLQELADTDPLTGLLNRRGFDHRWRKAKAGVIAQAVPLSVMLIDIDHFKNLNDQHGHHHGDTALITLAGALRSLARKMDIICRMGGDEFVLAALGADSTGLVTLAQRLQAQLGEDDLADSEVLQISIGIACSDDHDLDELLTVADKALYRSKQAGRNCIQVAKVY